MRISYINGVCVRNDAISNAVRDEIRFFHDSGETDLRLYAFQCDYPDLFHQSADNCADVVLSRHFQTSDLLIFHFGIYSPLFNLLAVAPRRAKKIVVFHNITPALLVAEPDRPLIERSYAQLQNIRWADRVICVSSTNRDLLREHGLDRNAVVVPLAIRSNLKAPASKPSFHDDVLRITFIGRFTLSKGPDQLLRVIEVNAARLRRLGFRRIQVDLVGNLHFSDRALLVQLHAKIESMQSRDGSLKASIHGNATEDTKNRLLQDADLFVLPTQHEGFCVPIVEAIASGCRVVAYDNSNTPAICGGLGSLAPTSDVDALGNAMADLADDIRSPEWRVGVGASSYAAYARSGAQHVRQFAPEEVAARFLGAVHETMEGRFAAAKG